MKLLNLSLLTLVFVGSFAVMLSKPEFELANTNPLYKSFLTNYSNLPVLSTTSSFPILSAQGVIAMDSNSGVVLYEKDSDLKLFPASTTKIVTALVAIDSYPKDKIITVAPFVVEGQKMGLIQKEEITIDSLMNGLLIYSANDAAEVLAQSYEGGRDGFIVAMNKKAQELHLSNTHFVNPSGLDEDGHYSTAKDMARVAEVAMENPYFASIVATKKKTVTSVDGKIPHFLTNINELLGKVDGVMGVKTGYTEGARENLVTYIDRGGKKVLIALLGSQDRFGETKELINWIFENYKWEPVK